MSQSMTNQGFIEVGGQFVRLDAITRIGTRSIAGLLGVEQHFVYLSDGGTVVDNDQDAERILKALSGADEASEKTAKRTRRKEKVT